MPGQHLGCPKLSGSSLTRHLHGMQTRPREDATLRRDEYIAYMQRVMRNYTLPVCEHEQVLGVSRVRDEIEVPHRRIDRRFNQLHSLDGGVCIRCYLYPRPSRAW